MVKIFSGLKFSHAKLSVVMGIARKKIQSEQIIDRHNIGELFTILCKSTKMYRIEIGPETVPHIETKMVHQ